MHLILLLVGYAFSFSTMYFSLSTTSVIYTCIAVGLFLVFFRVCRAPFVFGILLQLLRDSSNFKIRIQAAAALAVPVTVHGIHLCFFYAK